jgi:hypothetical protein
MECTQLEARARPQRRIEEHQGDRLAFELIAEADALVSRGLDEQRIEVLPCPILGIEEVLHRGSLR